MTLPRYEDRYVKVNGKNIRYWLEGEGAAVILVHGLACSAEFWQYTVGPLSDQYRVCALDLLGFGRSDKDIGEFTLSHGASFLADFMDALEIERATLVGNSLGGVISGEFSAQFPERLDKMILVDSAAFGRELQLLLRLWSVPALGSILFTLYQRAFPALKKSTLSHFGAIDGEWFAGAAAAVRMPGVKENSLRLVRIGVDLGGQREELFRDLHERLAGVTAPTLIIWGSDDLIVPVSHAYAAHTLIPNSELRIMRGCGHTPQLERPLEFNQLVLDFLSEEG
jgi:pimeloyl-ACP methyl ester carboxylesterase